MDNPTQCTFVNCKNVLGNESRELGYYLCHEHRKCSKCSQELRPEHTKLWFEMQSESTDNIDVTHPRCSVTYRPTMNDDPSQSIKQSEYDYLNMIRLSVEPDKNLSEETNENNSLIHTGRFVDQMDWDSRYLYMKKLEACLARVQISLNCDKKKIKERLDAREQVKFEEAKVQSRVSSKPVSIPVTDENEILLAAFMERNGITDRKTAIKKARERQKLIEHLTKSGFPLTEATRMIDLEMEQQASARKLEKQGNGTTSIQ